MKKRINFRLVTLPLIILKCMFFNAQTVINFSYDNGGNLRQRNISVLPPMPGGRFVNPFSDSEKNDSLNVLEFNVYPNPTSSFINIEGSLPDNIENADLYLYNSIGKILIKEDYIGKNKIVNVDHLKPGLYYLEIKYSKKSSSNYKVLITN